MSLPSLLWVRAVAAHIKLGGLHSTLCNKQTMNSYIHICGAEKGVIAEVPGRRWGGEGGMSVGCASWHPMRQLAMQ